MLMKKSCAARAGRLTSLRHHSHFSGLPQSRSQSHSQLP